MANPELLTQLKQLSRSEKFQVIQYLTAELAKEEGISTGNEATEMWSAAHTSHGAAAQLMQLLETEQKRSQNA